MLSPRKLGGSCARARRTPHNLEDEMTSLGRGDVVLTTDGQLGIVWRTNATQVWFVPVARGFGRRHRAEISVASAWAALGVPMRDPVAECHRVHVKMLKAVRVVGRAPEDVLAAVIAAVTREAQVRMDEERRHFSPRVSLAPLLG